MSSVLLGFMICSLVAPYFILLYFYCNRGDGLVSLCVAFVDYNGLIDIIENTAAEDQQEDERLKFEKHKFTLFLTFAVVEDLPQFLM